MSSRKAAGLDVTIIAAVMQKLRGRGVLALPMHDGLAARVADIQTRTTARSRPT